MQNGRDSSGSASVLEVCVEGCEQTAETSSKLVSLCLDSRAPWVIRSVKLTEGDTKPGVTMDLRSHKRFGNVTQRPMDDLGRLCGLVREPLSAPSYSATLGQWC